MKANLKAGLTVVAASVLLVGCVSGSSESPSSKASEPNPVHVPHGCSENADGFSRKAPPYRGEGTHPIKIVRQGGKGRLYVMSGGMYRIPEVEYTDTLGRWGGYWDRQKGLDAETELTVCFTTNPLPDLVSPASGEVERQCSYDGGSLPVHKATYEYTVFETRTGRNVGHFSLEGNQKYLCETAVTSIKNDGHSTDDIDKFVEGPSQKSLVEKLKPYVEGSAK